VSAQEKTYRTGVLLALGGALLASTGGALIKSVSMDPFTLNALRCLIGGAVLLPWARLREIRPGPWLPVLLVAYIHTLIGFVYGTSHTTAANAIALQATAPVWVWLLTLPLHKGRPLKLVPPLLVILAGLGIMLSEPAGGASRWGDLVALSTGFSLAVVQISLSRVHLPAISAVCVSNLSAGLVSLALIPEGVGSISATGQEWVAILLFGTMHSALAFVLIAMSLKRLPVTQVSILGMAEPLLNPMWVYLVASEAPSLHGLVGWGGIMAGILLDSLVRRGMADKARPATTDACAAGKTPGEEPVRPQALEEA